MPEVQVKVTIQKDYTVQWQVRDDPWPATEKRYTSLKYQPRMLLFTLVNGKLSHATASGPRIVKGGYGAQDVRETFYKALDIPGWVGEIINAAMGKGDYDV